MADLHPLLADVAVNAMESNVIKSSPTKLLAKQAPFVVLDCPKFFMVVIISYAIPSFEVSRTNSMAPSLIGARTKTEPISVPAVNCIPIAASFVFSAKATYVP